MNWLKSHRRLLGIVAALVLVAGVAGFAFTRGFFMHFVLDDQTISRDAFWSLADQAMDGGDIHLGCAQGDWTLGFVYVYEIHCFTDDDALDAYMQEHFGSS